MVWAAAEPGAGWGQWLCWDGGSSCEHPGADACESFSQPWLLVMPGETETRFRFGASRAMEGAEQPEEGISVNVMVLFAGCRGLQGL